ncbi:endonuclease/exonuclease/phosphatase family protein [Nitratireductor sp. StC3]|uniref:endonuclease/exonuclease/phosphatase family protein n=1 Tax=Nitratireductor sp. StC3 TaxID=2126741 RepID=UPI0011B25C81|nr:endonuclease/exonuclease/phosphatase family protein [Nitratireductor sp. StC3]
MTAKAIRIACWNAQWHRASSPKGREIQQQLLAIGADVICCPEAHVNFLPRSWHGAFSDPDTGYPIWAGRRKVTLWSRHPWVAVDDLGSPDLPSGRFVRATTMTSLGALQVIGICVPWSAAHVSGGRRDRKRWEDHTRYLRALRSVLRASEERVPSILLGDFNQRIPRHRAPIYAYEELTSALGSFTIWTTGEVRELDRQPLCHIGSSKHLSAVGVKGLSRRSNGTELSDHDGLVVELVPTGGPALES